MKAPTLHYNIDRDHKACSLGIRVGQRWLVKQGRHRTCVVEVLSINSLSVVIAPRGSAWSKAQRDKRWTVPFEKFHNQHDLLKDMT